MFHELRVHECQSQTQTVKLMLALSGMSKLWPVGRGQFFYWPAANSKSIMDHHD